MSNTKINGKKLNSKMLILVALLLACAAPAMAAEHPKPFSALFTNLPSLAWLIVSLLATWIVSVGLTALFGPKGYPPLVARGAWLFSFSVWLVCFLIFFLGGMLHWAIHLWMWALTILLLVVLLMLVLSRRSHVAR